MKAVFYLPAHPSYFDDEYTQEEIDKALADYDRACGGLISKGNSVLPVKKEVFLLREPGKDPTVVFNSEGYDEVHKEYGIDQYRGTSDKELRTHINNIKTYLKANRDGVILP